MANLTDLDVRVCLDDTSGNLADITSYLTSASIRGALDLIEDTALNDTERSYLAGKAGATIPLAGMVNSTTNTILAPLMGNRTSVTKTIEYQTYSTGSNSTGNTGIFYRGEVFLTNIEYSGSLNSLQTFSADCTFDGVVTRATQSTV
jgi:hypothetical protein